MFARSTVLTIILTLLSYALGVPDSAFAQSRIYGTLKPVRSWGKCNFNANFPTDSSATRIIGRWYLYDKQDTLATGRSQELFGGRSSSFPATFTSNVNMITGTYLMYGSTYNFTGWDKKRKTVNMLKESWVFSGWGSSTQIHCSGVWAAEVKYK